MKKPDISFIVCFLLILALAVTGISGFIQVKLDLHRTTIHKFSAYSTLSLSLVHILINFRKFINYAKKAFRK